MSHSVGRHLRIEVEDYDREIRRFIPGYEEMLDLGARAVFDANPGLVIDLGAGTGGFSERVLERVPGAVVELWDVDPEMLRVASKRLAAFSDRVRYRTRSYDAPFPECDAMVASLSLHHIPDLPRKAELYARASRAIRPGGVLVNADVTMPEAGSERDARYREWADHLVASGIVEARAWRHFEEWSEEDTYFPVDEELSAMGAAGFEAFAAWSDGPATLMVATR